MPALISDADLDGVLIPDVVPEAPQLPNGERCAEGGQCQSGFCAQGVCCADACMGACHACNLASSPGECRPVPAGEDPREDCSTEAPSTCGRDGTCDGAGACRLYPKGAECQAGRCTDGVEHAAGTCPGGGVPCLAGQMRSCTSGMCSGQSCASPCTGNGNCQPGFFCNAGQCAVKRANAAACTSGDQCASGHCVDKVCCDNQCSPNCFACNITGSVGTCKAAPLGADPRSQCAAEPPTTCGRAGGCNGMGACRLHAADTPCGGTPSCTGTTETRGRTCDGLGVCRAEAPVRDCAPYACAATACATSCSDSAGCAPAYSCQANQCLRVPGLALYWRFEETSNLGTIDQSGNGRNGVYGGNSGTFPIASTEVPALMYPNTRSRNFNRNSRHAVQLTTSEPKPVNDFTVAAWYQATSTDTNGADIVSGWNGFILRLRGGGVEFAKRVGNSDFPACRIGVAAATDGRWHHLAGTASATSGMKLYFDGKEICALNEPGDIVYNPSAVGLFVGRHGDGQDSWDFSGNIDEVRVYTRPLSSAEIAALAQGRNN